MFVCFSKVCYDKQTLLLFNCRLAIHEQSLLCPLSKNVYQRWLVEKLAKFALLGKLCLLHIVLSHSIVSWGSVIINIIFCLCSPHKDQTLSQQKSPGVSKKLDLISTFWGYFCAPLPKASNGRNRINLNSKYIWHYF